MTQGPATTRRRPPVVETRPVDRMTTLYRSSVGKKFAMAVSGLILFGFVFLHMLGNLKVFQGPEAIDNYSGFLRTFGYPVAPDSSMLWVARITLLAAVGLHMTSAFQLWRQSRTARVRGYEKERSQVFSYASRTMRWGGIIIAAFAVYHVLHMTTGSVHPQFQHGAVYSNVVIGFQSFPVVAVYLLAVAALTFHLYHGLWSAVTTLGVQHPGVVRLRRPVATFFSVVLFVGYVAVPLAVLAGFLTLES